MGFPKGLKIPFGQGRDKNPVREAVSFIRRRFEPSRCRSATPARALALCEFVPSGEMPRKVRKIGAPKNFY